MPSLKCGFLNTQHLTDLTNKKAAISQLWAGKHWTFLSLCEAMNSASETERRDIPEFGRETMRVDLQEFRSFQVAAALAHNEFKDALAIQMYNSYQDARYVTHEADQQLQYALVTSPEAPLEADLDPGLLGAKATASMRCPLHLTIDVGDPLHVFVWHPPSGNHDFARMLQVEVLTQIAARLGKKPWALVGDLNCSPTELMGNDCHRTNARYPICGQGTPHTFVTPYGSVHCPGVATRRTGTLDFAVSSFPGAIARPVMDLEVAESFGFDHLPIELELPF